MFTPYAIDKVKDPVRLCNQGAYCQPKTTQDLNRTKFDTQMNMAQEALRRIREAAEEDVYCLVDLVVKLIRN